MKNLILSIVLLSSIMNFAQQKEDLNLRGERHRVAQGIKIRRTKI